MIEKIFNLIEKVHDKVLDIYSRANLNTSDNIYFNVQKYKLARLQKYSTVVSSSIVVGNKVFDIYISSVYHDKGISLDISELKHNHDVKNLQSKGLKNAKWEYNQCIRIDKGQDAIYEKIKEQILKYVIKINKKALDDNKKDNLEIEFNEKFKQVYKSSTNFLTSLNDAYINHEKKMLGKSVSFAKTSSKRVSKL